MTRTILIVEDEQTLRESLQRLFTKEGFRVDTAGSAEEALSRTEDTYYDAVISDIILPGIDGIEMLTRIRENQPDIIFIVVTAYASLDTSVKALRVGAYDYIMKPIIHEEIKQVVGNALRQRRLERENLLLKRQVDKEYDFSSIIGEQGSLRKIVSEVKKIADTKSNVLLLGETGTGKELIARVVHGISSRGEMPFVPINCSAIPDTLLESELFGYAKGAFTGAVQSKNGLLDEASGGTMFLDEIGDMPPALQAKLLRVFEDQEIRPLGSTKTKRVDIRFITATNQDLWGAVEKGTFREDLYYRINVITIQMPPLRDRKEDITELIQHYLDRYRREFGKTAREISPEALSILSSYRWPGNIRELQNVLERAVLICEGSRIEEPHLPDSIQGKGSFIEHSMRRELSIEEYIRSFIANYQHRYGEQELADKLGITRKTLWEKRKKWGFKRPAAGAETRQA
ncbi:sigma-54-dependent transcriptional regulator [Candidatus Moduliflexota bacterium]